MVVLNTSETEVISQDRKTKVLFHTYGIAATINDGNEIIKQNNSSNNNKEIVRYIIDGKEATDMKWVQRVLITKLNTKITHKYYVWDSVKVLIVFIYSCADITVAGCSAFGKLRQYLATVRNKHLMAMAVDKQQT